MKINIPKYFAFMIAMAAALVSCSHDADKAGSEGTMATTEVTLGHPSRTRLVDNLALNATSAYLNQEIVRSSLQGYVEKTYKNIGEAVRSGDILFTIKTKEAAILDTAIGNVYRSNPDNPTAAKFPGLVAIKARSSGIMSAVSHQEGDYVTDGDQLAIIADPSSLVIMLNAPWQNASLVATGQNYQVRLPDSRVILARATRKIPYIDPQSQTQTIILEPAAGTLLPVNLNVIVLVPQKVTPDALVVPKSAVVADETLTSFWIMQAIDDSTAIRVDITKGMENDSLVEVLEPGLGEGDRIVTRGAYGMSDTARISITGNGKDE